jgi:hypothetical protein
MIDTTNGERGTHGKANRPSADDRTVQHWLTRYVLAADVVVLDVRHGLLFGQIRFIDLAHAPA